MKQEKVRHSLEQHNPTESIASSETMLLCYFFLLLCLIWGAVLWQSEQDRRSTESQIVSINDNLAKAYEDHTQNALTRIEKVLAFLKADYEMHARSRLRYICW